MFCPKCHTHITNDSVKFCGRCGETLDKKKKSTFSTFSHKTKNNNFSLSSTFKYTSKYGKKSNLDKFNYENINNNDTQIINNQIITNQCNINQPATNNNHNEQFNYSLNYSNVTKKRQTHDEQFNYNVKYSNVTKKSSTHDEQYNYSQKYSNETYQQPQQRTYNRAYFNQQTEFINDDTYSSEFIGQNKDAIIKSDFSLPCLIFGPLYLIYRKMFALGIGLQILIFLFTLYLGENGNFLQIIINVILGFNFKTLYLNYVNKQVKSIQENNQDKTSKEIMYICSQKGRTIKLKTTIGLAIALYFATMFITTIHYTFNSNIEVTENNNIEENEYIDEEIDEDIDENIDEDIYEEVFDVYTINDYEFKISSGLIKNKTYGINTLELEYLPTSSPDRKCKFIIEHEYTNTSARNSLINEQQKYIDMGYTISEINSVLINNKTWYKTYFYPSVSNDYVKVYTMKDYSSNEVYKITTLSYNTKSCENMTDIIIKNMKRNY